MQELSHEQKLANIDLATRLWKERVKPEQVVQYLHTWACGTQACFGGHLATWPEFREMGVRTLKEIGVTCSNSWASAPCMEYGRFEGVEVAAILFGDPTLFDARGACRFDDERAGVSDHGLVLGRLEAARTRLLQEGQQ
jgi:hypothetical protein